MRSVVSSVLFRRDHSIERPSRPLRYANRKNWPFILSADFAKLHAAQKKGQSLQNAAYWSEYFAVKPVPYETTDRWLYASSPCFLVLRHRKTVKVVLAHALDN